MGKSEKLRVQKVEFLGEQDGVPEQKLKALLTPLLKRNESVVRTYLVRVSYDNLYEFNVALCVRTEVDIEPELMSEINRIFAETFRVSEHLDVIFLNGETEKRVASVANPFYSAKRE